MTDYIRLSIIVPVYNAARYISKCVNSLKLVKQDNVEFIIINDGSTDDSDIIIQKW
jgi:glycosyltransferase involved in cell wall biosynthesis